MQWMYQAVGRFSTKSGNFKLSRASEMIADLWNSPQITARFHASNQRESVFVTAVIVRVRMDLARRMRVAMGVYQMGAF